MEVWLCIIAVAVLIAAVPYIRLFFKRLSFHGKIKQICRRKNYVLHKNHPLYLFGRRHAKKCDFYIETPNQVFAVKLFSMPRQKSILIFKENGDYFIRSFIVFLSFGASVADIPINHRPRPVPVYNFRYKYKDEWEIKTPRNILLLNPVSMEVRRQPERGAEVIVGAGDVVHGMEIESLSRLLGELENAI